MIKGFLFLLPLVFMGLIPYNRSKNIVNDGLLLSANERGNYTLVGVSEELYDDYEIRVYHEDNKVIDEISDTAFTSCTNLSSLMLTYSVAHINDAALIDSIETIYYTGSKEMYDALNLTKQLEVNYYSYDEGFIKYWNDEIRPEEKESICDIGKERFNTIYQMYSNLLLADKKVVDNYVDSAGAKIGDSMATLINMFKTTKPSNNTTNEWNQSGAISLIIVISVIGMTSICIFFLLKTKQIIN